MPSGNTGNTAPITTHQHVAHNDLRTDFDVCTDSPDAMGQYPEVRNMTLSTLTHQRTIRSRCACREEFSSCSTGNMGWSEHTGYYSTKGHAVNAFDGVLQDYDLCLDRDDLADFLGDTGRKMIAVHDEFGNTVGYAILMWYRVHSGRYEFTGYLT